MNIMSSTPINNQPNIENLHKMYIQARQQPSDNNQIIKNKAKIRIKSKSQGRFLLIDNQKDKQVKVQNQGKTISLMSIVKQARSKKSMSIITEDKRTIFLPQEDKFKSNQRQLLFLKELVNRKKQMPQTQNGSMNRSHSQSQLNQSNLFKEKQENHEKILKSSRSPLQINLNEQDRKKAYQYQYYDSIVKDLLSEMSNRKPNSRSRPLISPNKYCQAKQKLINKIQTDTNYSSSFSNTFSNTESGICNFKAMIKIPPVRKQSMVFRMSDCMADTVYERKINSYVNFLYKINFSNCVYTDLSLSNPGKSYKVKVGRGNNSELIKMLLKRRFWLQIDNTVQVSQTKQQNKISFIWTQNTIQNVFKFQTVSKTSQNLSKKPQQNQKILKRVRKLKKIDKNKQILTNNQKILNTLQAEQSQTFYASSNNGTMSIYSKIEPEIVSNHIPANYIIGSKKILFMVLHWYYQNIMKIDPFTYLPKTYHIKSGEVNNPSFQTFLKNESSRPDTVWIVKPGQNTNRGNGINVTSFNEVNRLIRRKQMHKNGQEKTYIVQKYLKPFLYNGRKFDIRHYMLITSVKGNIKAYWYKEGYIRTSSQKYDLEDLGNQFIHLTNDAIQKKSQLYGKYQPGNKLSYNNFQRYLDQTYPQKKYSFETQILKKMKQITTDLINASFSFLDPQRKNHNFEIYGMDFMINSKFEPYLIQVNANPCLEVSCPVLERIIPTMVEHSLRIALDPLFPPPEHYPINSRYQLSDRIIQKIKFELIFDQKFEGGQIRQKIQSCQNKFILASKYKIEPDQQTFEDDGKDTQNFQID